MAIANTTLQIRKSGTPGVKPTALANGELAINFADDKLYYTNKLGNISYFYGANNGPGFAAANVNNTLILSTIPNDTLSFISGNNATITACTTTKTITVNAILDPAFNAANSAASFANSAYTKANTGGTLTGAVHITDGTQSITDQSGALIVDGGVGILKDLNVGGDALITGSLTVIGGVTTANSTTVTYVNPYITLHDPTGNTWITGNDGDDIGIMYEYYDPLGASYVVLGGSGNGTTATLTLSDHHVTPVGQVINIAGVTPSGFNGTFIVTASTISSVSFLNPTNGSVDTSGALGTARRVTQFSMNSGTWSSQVANVAFTLGSPSVTLPTGKYITVTDCSPAAYNGTYTILASGPGYIRYNIGNPNPGPITAPGKVTLENRHAFSGWSNDSGYFEYYKSGNFDASGSFGGLYGGIKAGALIASPPQSISATDLTAGGFLQVPTATVYDSSTPTNGVVTQVSSVASLGITTVGSANANVTYTNSATLYIAGAPVAGNNVTMAGNTYALEVASGKSWFSGDVEFHSANGITFFDGTKQSTNAAPYSYSFSGYTQANNAASFANGAFTLANTNATNITTIQGVDVTQNTNITSAQSFANGAFVTANSGASFANGAFTVANTATTNIVTIQGVDVTQNTNITSAQSFANGAFVTANSAASFANGAFSAANTKLSASGFTNNGVMYANGSGYVVNGSALTFNGTTLFRGGADSAFAAVVSGVSKAVRFGMDSAGSYVEGVDNTGAGSYQPLFVGGSDLRFLISGSEQMRLTSTGLGVGTSSPAVGLDVTKAGVRLGVTTAYKVASAKDSTPNKGVTLGYDSGSQTGIIIAETTSASSNLAFWTYESGASGWAERMRLDSSGNLGLGVTPSAWDTSYKVFQSSYAVYGGNTGSIQLGHNWYYNAGLKYISTAAASNYYQYQGAHIWQNAPSGTAGNAVTFTQAMTLDASGRLGIATTSPATNLHVYSSGNTELRIQAGLTAFLELVNGNSYRYDIQSNSADNSLRFVDQNVSAERARIGSDGTFGIGTTGGVNADGNLAVAGSIGTGQGATNTVAQINIWETTSGNKAGLWFGAMTNQNTGVIGSRTATGNIAFQTYNGGWAERMRLTYEGNLLVGTTSLASGFSTYAQIEASSTTGGVLINSATNNIGRLMFTNNNTSGNEGLIRYDGSNSSMQFWTAAGERARIDSSGRVIIGATASRSVGGSDKNLQIEATYAGMSLTSTNSNTNGSILVLAKSRNNAIVLSGDQLGTIQFNGHDSSGFDSAAAGATIMAHADGTVSTGVVPGRLSFFTSDTSGTNIERVRITSAGNVGIGTSSPAQKLEVSGSSQSGVIYQRISNSFGSTTSNGGGTALQFYGWDAGITANIKSIREAQAYSPSYLSFETFGGNGNTGGNALAERMRIDGYGNVGIGTSSPSVKLEVNQAATAFPGFKITGSNSPGMQIVETSGTVTTHFVNDSAGGYIGTTTSHPLVLRTVNTERMRLTANGGLAFNGASNYGTAGYVLQSNGDAPPTWVAAGSSTSLTSTYVGYGSGSNTLTGSAALTFDGTILNVNGPSNNGYIRFATNTGPKLRFYDASTDKYGIEIQSSELRIYSGAQGDSTGGITFGKYDGTTYTEAVRIQNQGNVGIGTSSPTAKLTVDTTGTSGYWERFYNSGTELAYFYFDATTLQLSSKSATRALTFLTNDIERMRLDSSGNMGIGTTSLAGMKLVALGATGYPATSGTTQTGVLRLTGGTGLYNVLDMGVNESTDTAWIQATRANNLATYDKLVINPYGGNVGIGTSSPAYKLDVVGNAGIARIQSTGSGQNSQLNLQSTVATWSIGQNITLTSTGTLEFYNGSTRLQLDSSGNLGLGVTPSAWSGGYKGLEVGRVGLGLWQVSNSFGITSNAYNNAGWKYAVTGLGASLTESNAGAFNWYNAPSGTAGNAITFTQAMTLDSSGRLGVGTTAPSAIIHSSSSGLGDGGGIKIQNTGSGGATFAIWPTATVNGEGAGKLIISGPSGNAVTLDSSGNLLVGITSGSYKFMVGDGTRNMTINTNSSLDAIFLGTTTSKPLIFGTGDAERMRIDSSGNIGVGTTAPTAKLDVISGTGASGGLSVAVTGEAYGPNAISARSTVYDVAGTVVRIGANANSINTASLLSFNAYNSGNGATGVYAGAVAGPTGNGAANFVIGRRTAAQAWAESLRVDTSGNVGISTTSPSERLHVSGTIRVDGGGSGIRVFQNGASTINSHIYFANSGNSAAYNWQLDENNNAAFWGYTSSWNKLLTITSAGNVGIGTSSPGYKLEVNGSFAATTKSFVIDHPTKPGMKLRYGSLEGPENGVYVRGRLKDCNKIELPEYWTKLVDPDSITVNLTAIGKSQELYVEDIVDNVVYIGGENINCFYTVFAERVDVDKLEVEIE